MSTLHESSEASVAIVLQSPAYVGSLARSALDLAMSYAVFSQNPQLIFTGPAVSALVGSQEPDSIGRKSLRKVIDSFPLYDLEQVFVDEASLTAHGVAPALLPDFVKVLSAAAIRSLKASATHVISL